MMRGWGRLRAKQRGKLPFDHVNAILILAVTIEAVRESSHVTVV